MDYRNIDRSLVLNKALRKYAKGRYSLKPSELYILSSVAYGYNSAILIHEYLKGFYRTYPLKMIIDALSRFVDLNLVVKSGVKYIITFNGQAALKDIDQYIRITRKDK